VGTIAIRTGMPPGEDPGGWNCGLYPGCHPRECTDGTAETFDQTRAEFEQRGECFYQTEPKPIFKPGADERDWTAEKYRRFDRGERMPPDWKPQRAVRANDVLRADRGHEGVTSVCLIHA